MFVSFLFQFTSISPFIFTGQRNIAEAKAARDLLTSDYCNHHSHFSHDEILFSDKKNFGLNC